MLGATCRNEPLLFQRPGKHQDADDAQVTRDTNGLILSADKPCLLEPTVRTLAQRTKQSFGPKIIDSQSCSISTSSLDILFLDSDLSTYKHQYDRLQAHICAFWQKTPNKWLNVEWKLNVTMVLTKCSLNTFTLLSGSVLFLKVFVQCVN